MADVTSVLAQPLKVCSHSRTPGLRILSNLGPSLSNAGSPAPSNGGERLGGMTSLPRWRDWPPRESGGRSPAGSKAAHLGALHLPVDHKQEDTGTRGRHGRAGGARKGPRQHARLLRGTGVVLETDGMACRTHLLETGPSRRQVLGGGGGARAQSSGGCRRGGTLGQGSAIPPSSPGCGESLWWECLTAA